MGFSLNVKMPADGSIALARTLLLGVVVTMLVSTSISIGFEFASYIVFAALPEPRRRLCRALRYPIVVGFLPLAVVTAVAALYGPASWADSLGALLGWRRMLLLPLAAAIFDDEASKRLVLKVIVVTCLAGALASLVIVWGMSLPSWLGLAAWRWMFLVATLPALIYGTLVLGVPESPRYLVAKNRLAEARVVLRSVLNMHNEAALDDKLRDIEDSLHLEHQPRLSDLLGKAAGLLPVVWIGILLSVFQQFVGINVIFYYSSTLWHSVGFSEADSFTITVATSIVNVLVTLVAIALVDRIGRKPLLVIGSAGMALTLGLMAWCFSQATGSGATLSLPGATGIVALVAANAYVVFFGVSWGPVVWVLLGEMFPNRIRATALAVAAAAQWLANFAITSSFPALAEIGLTFAYGLYAGFALLSLLFVLYAVRETKGVELEDMQA